MTNDGQKARLDYETSKALARDADPAVRAKLASNKNLPPEILYYLAEDESAEVRRQVANNEAAPDLTHALLVNDEAEDVRSGLAVKIAKSLEDSDKSRHEKSREMSRDALAKLAGDQIIAVRKALAEAIKDVPGAPSDVILKMAGDQELQVAGPILEHSPVLSPDQLIDIIESPRTPGILNFISKRQNVDENVSDAIVATDDLGAIADLLSNKSAQIQETTLDTLVDKAEGIELWHAPLVSRPTLPDTAATRLAHFVATNLLEELQQRDDIDDATLNDVRKIVEDRLQDGVLALENESDIPHAAQDFLTMELPMEMVQRLYNDRKLVQGLLEKSLDAGDYSFVLAALLVCSNVKEDVAKLIFKEKSAKGIVAICRLASIPLELIVKIQQRMGRVPPSAVLQPVGGGYPLTEDEADWQIEFHTNLIQRISKPLGKG